MKKADFAEKLAADLGITKKEAVNIIEKYNETIIDAVKRGDEVVFPEMGKYILKNRPARTARNPITGAEVQVPAKIVPAFRPNKKFKEAVAGSGSGNKPGSSGKK